MEFGKRLKELRLAKGFTQEELAKQMNLTKTAISYYENGKNAPSPKVAAEFCKIFNISLDTLMGIDSVQGQYIDVSGLSAQEIVAVETIVQMLRKK